MTIQELNAQLNDKLNTINMELKKARQKMANDPSYINLLSQRVEQLRKDKSMNESMIGIIAKMKLEGATDISSLVA